MPGGFASAAAAIYVLALLWIAACLAFGHRKRKINLWDLLTATDRAGVVRTDGRKLFETGAFAVMTITFCYLTVVDKLTEWYALVYVGSWVVARVSRDIIKTRNLEIADSSYTASVLNSTRVIKDKGPP